MSMTYTVKPIIVGDCNCEDCKAGRHLYVLYRLPATGSDWSAMSLQTYASPEEAKAKHWWGIDFGPNAVWEDGTPVVESDPAHPAPEERDQSNSGLVYLDTEALGKAAEALQKHWRPGSGLIA